MAMFYFVLGILAIAIGFVVTQTIRWRRALADRNAAVVELIEKVGN